MASQPGPTSQGGKSEDHLCLPVRTGGLETPADRLALLETVVQALPFGVAVHDGHGRTVLINDVEAQALGFALPTPALPGSERGPPRADEAKSGAPAPAPATALAYEALGCSEDPNGLVRTRSIIQVSDQPYMVSTSFDLSEQKKVEEELFRRAFLDELTGLPNRSFLKQHFEALVARRGDTAGFALAFIDIDNFKHINDYYSHAVGDELLIKIARRICGELRETDMLARLGGDEFVLLLAPAVRPEDIGETIGNLLERLRQPFFIDGHEVFSSASIGVSHFPTHGSDYDTLRRCADIAMYNVKGGTKGGMALFNIEMSKVAAVRMETEQRLRLAIRDRRFCCAYQPKVDVRTREITGLEVLLRWRDEQGLIRAPGDFIGLAIELGLINDITLLVLSETMAAIDEIDDVFGTGTTISLNVAARQADDVGFMSSFAEALSNSGHAERLMLELTEEAFFAKNKFQVDVLPMLRAIGTRVSIDDFGVGYSSLSALADITADEIKVDRSFITDIHRRPRSQSILKAVESLGHALGMSVVAEGLETYEELAYLQAATQIRYAQGFYFAKPLFLEQLLAKRTPAQGSRQIVASRLPANSRARRTRG